MNQSFLARMQAYIRPRRGRESIFDRARYFHSTFHPDRILQFMHPSCVQPFSGRTRTLPSINAGSAGHRLSHGHSLMSVPGAKWFQQMPG